MVQGQGRLWNALVHGLWIQKTLMVVKACDCFQKVNMISSWHRRCCLQELSLLLLAAIQDLDLRFEARNTMENQILDVKAWLYESRELCNALLQVVDVQLRHGEPSAARA